jgi:Uma2 family endonuclease
MGISGILTEDDRVELIEGEIVEMTPIGSGHAGCVNRLNQLLADLIGKRALLSVQNPLRLSGHSEPQPDLTLLKHRKDYYATAHPEPGDVLLLIEVAETSASYDRDVKVPLYAREGIVEVWIVDLEAEVVDVYRNPSQQGYGESRRIPLGQHISPQAFPNIALSAEQILG